MSDNIKVAGRKHEKSADAVIFRCFFRETEAHLKRAGKLLF